jgi:hypothetical protein
LHLLERWTEQEGMQGDAAGVNPAAISWSIRYGVDAASIRHFGVVFVYLAVGAVLARAVALAADYIERFFAIERRGRRQVAREASLPFAGFAFPAFTYLDTGVAGLFFSHFVSLLFWVVLGGAQSAIE